MFGIHDFGLFLAAGVLLNLTPGPDTAYILGRTVARVAKLESPPRLESARAVLSIRAPQL
jgi:hypothetical protein